MNYFALKEIFTSGRARAQARGPSRSGAKNHPKLGTVHGNKQGTSSELFTSHHFPSSTPCHTTVLQSTCTVAIRFACDASCSSNKLQLIWFSGSGTRANQCGRRWSGQTCQSSKCTFKHFKCAPYDTRTVRTFVRNRGNYTRQHTRSV